MHLDLVALADADELARNMAAESPEGVADPVGEPPFELPHFEMDDDLGRVVTMDRRRDIRRVGENRVLLADDRIGEVVLARSPVSGPGHEDRRQDRP